MATKKEREQAIRFAKQFEFSEKEEKIFLELVLTEESIQDIAKKLYISRTALYRHIARIFDKTGTKTRIGVVQKYYKWLV